MKKGNEGKINLTAIFLAGFPVLVFVALDAIFCYLPDSWKVYALFPGVFLGVICLKWWQIFKIFLYAKKFDVRIEDGGSDENQEKDRNQGPGLH